MNKLFGNELIARGTVSCTHPAPPHATPAGDRLRVFLLLGLVASQCYHIPLFSLAANWALWPSLPDLFAAGLVISTVFRRRPHRLNRFDRGNLRDLAFMAAVFGGNFLLVSLPAASDPEGLRYGLYSVYAIVKCSVIYWAVSHIPLDDCRIRRVHRAALLAFALLTGTVLAGAFGLLEMTWFTDHLPRETAGPWAVPALSSTAARSHGVTAAMVLLLGALTLATGPTCAHGLWLAVIGAAAMAALLVGSRQGLIRVLVFAGVSALRSPRVVIVWVILLCAVAVSPLHDATSRLLFESESARAALERQTVLLRDPLSEEGLSGRPELWRKALERFSESPEAVALGLGVGSSYGAGSIAHNLFLQALQETGIIGGFLVLWAWVRVFRRVFAARRIAWFTVALTAGLLSSVLTSTLFYPSLSESGLLILYFVILRITIGARCGEVAHGDLRICRG